ncbi:MAG: asparaginase [Synergistaceae bacterium]|nr:asparaginase [Synergistaceae bacterium]
MKILLISTGGTIASQQSAEGLVPMDQGEALAARVPGIYQIADIDIANVFSKDSSNINPADWAAIIRCIRENQSYDGYVVTHGTDTMAYTSAALSYVIRDIEKPVVLTGSMIPMSEPGTDAKRNLEDAFRFMEALLAKGQPGISVTFAGRLIHGPRAKKMSGKRLEAFKSVYYDELGLSEGKKVTILKAPFIDRETLCKQGALANEIHFSNEVMPVKLFPGFRADYFDRIVEMRPKAIVVECFGFGGLPYIGEDLLPGIKKAVDLGILPVITTQCPEGGVDLSTYDVGQKTLKTGAVSALDMGFEAILTKLMWLIPQMPVSEAAKYLTRNLCDEVGSK